MSHAPQSGAAGGASVGGSGGGAVGGPVARALDRADRAVATFEGALIVLMLTALVLLAFVRVVMRQWFETGMVWAPPVVRYLVLWLGFVGASLATRDGKHINIDIASRLLPGRARWAVEAVVSAAAAAVCLTAAWVGAAFLLDERASGAMFVEPVPLWVAESVMPMGFLVVGLRLTLRAARRAGAASSGVAPGDDLPPMPGEPGHVHGAPHAGGPP